ncbi:MAG: PolyA polymerase family protein [Parcubacteria group bacterium GW2011_GWA2_47_8]|nr:MAG: PolyA polymerase family protein [Parcubacteria group bacterium GW2011_GWA2_47_8]
MTKAKLKQQTQFQAVLPAYILDTIRTLYDAGFSVEIVGGPVRDLLMGAKPSSIKNWDLATDALPEEMMKLFAARSAFYENEFGTVTIPFKLDPTNDKLVTEVEITPYRVESRYSDKRHPDKVTFTKSLEEDLARRDFTVNAMALRIRKEEQKSTEDGVLCNIIDLYDGQGDIEKQIIRAVGAPQDRFNEDALRMLRAVRFATTLGFTIEAQTLAAIKVQAHDLQAISGERIRDEFNKIIVSSRPRVGIELLRETGLLKYVMPELEEGIGIGQRGDHKYDVYTHSLLAAQYAADQNYHLELRLAALMHDVGKPRTRELKGGIYTFYAHNTVGEDMAKKIMQRLKYSGNEIEKVTALIRHHMFFYDTEEVSESGVRRLLRRVGPENMQELLKLRILDRKATPVPKDKPYKLRHLEFMLEKVAEDPLDVKQLKIDGSDIMRLLKIEPGPIIGLLLKALLFDVIDDPKRNTKKYLEKRAKERGTESPEKLQKFVDKLYAHEDERVQGLKSKHWVK